MTAAGPVCAGLAALAISACDGHERGGPSSPPPSPPSPAAPRDSGANEERAYLVGNEGALSLVLSGAPPARIVCEVGPPARAFKLTNQGAVLARFKVGDPAAASDLVSLLVKLDLGAAPADEAARREALRVTGARPQTLAGDVATVLVTPQALCALLAVPWVTAVEAPGIALPR